jgi:hypothetical protein
MVREYLAIEGILEIVAINREDLLAVALHLFLIQKEICLRYFVTFRDHFCYLFVVFYDLVERYTNL